MHSVLIAAEMLLGLFGWRARKLYMYIPTTCIQICIHIAVCVYIRLNMHSCICWQLWSSTTWIIAPFCPHLSVNSMVRKLAPPICHLFTIFWYILNLHFSVYSLMNFNTWLVGPQSRSRKLNVWGIPEGSFMLTPDFLHNLVLVICLLVVSSARMQAPSLSRP